MEDINKALREGLEVYTADGTRLGKIDQIWYGLSASGIGHTEEETCFEVHHGVLRRQTFYIPQHAIQAIDNSRVTLKTDLQTIRETPSWNQKPAWIS